MREFVTEISNWVTGYQRPQKERGSFPELFYAEIFFPEKELNMKNLNIIVRKLLTYTRRLAYHKVSFIRGDNFYLNFLGNFPRPWCL